MNFALYDRKKHTIAAKRVGSCNKVDITDPIFDVPGQSASKNQNFIKRSVPIALSSVLVPINPRVSIDEFSKVLTLLMEIGENLHGPQDQSYTSAFRQYDATVNLHNFSPKISE